MDTNIVKIQDEELIVGTWDLSLGFELEHRVLKKFIKKYQSDFEEFGFSIASQVQRRSIQHGGQIEEYLLTEEQATYLTTLLKNNDIVRKFKRHLTTEFFRQRKLLNKIIIQKQNSDWQAKRAAGLIERRLETDTIKDFIEYATEQGSKNAKMYYVNITKMENNSLLNIELLNQKFENMRDVVDGFDLTSLQMADKIVAQAIREGMRDHDHYKDIYETARDRVEAFALVIGRTPLRMINKRIKPLTLSFNRGTLT